MKQKKKKPIKRCVTLIEMMIVMFLIAMIIGVVAYNYQGTLEESKAFKTKTNIEKLQNILSIELAQNPAAEDGLSNEWIEIIRKSPLVKNPNDLIKDGWGQEFTVTAEDGKVFITSDRMNQYLQKNPKSAFKLNEEE